MPSPVTPPTVEQSTDEIVHAAQQAVGHRTVFALAGGRHHPRGALVHARHDHRRLGASSLDMRHSSQLSGGIASVIDVSVEHISCVCAQLLRSTIDEKEGGRRESIEENNQIIARGQQVVPPSP